MAMSLSARDETVMPFAALSVSTLAQSASLSLLIPVECGEVFQDRTSSKEELAWKGSRALVEDECPRGSF